MFKSKENQFLAQILNSKKIEEVTYVFKTSKGRTILITNIESLEHFFKYSKNNHQKTIQNMLARSNYSIKEINSFAKSYAESFILKDK